MKITKKSVNAALPRLDQIRREYLMPGSVGIINVQRGHLSCAVAEADDDGIVSITLYAVGDAQKRNHYYGTDCIDVTDEIVEWVSDCYIDRSRTVDEIAYKLNEYYKEA